MPGLKSNVTWTRLVSSLRETGRALASELFLPSLSNSKKDLHTSYLLSGKSRTCSHTNDHNFTTFTMRKHHVAHRLLCQKPTKTHTRSCIEKYLDNRKSNPDQTYIRESPGDISEAAMRVRAAIRRSSGSTSPISAASLPRRPNAK
jgi:hypothetical protein